MTRILFALLLLSRALLYSQKAPAGADSLHAQYYRLEKKLALYQQLAPKWFPLEKPKPELREGSVNKFIALLRNRLDLEGYGCQVPFRPDSFDRSLATALREFQNANGVPETGKPDARTIGMLNVPLAERLQQIRVNMERWKTLPVVHRGCYVFVNVADFRLDAVEQDSVLLSMKVIVGRSRRQTPVIHSAIVQVVFNPSWTVPRSILQKDILPEVMKDTSYLTRKKLKLLCTDKKGTITEVSPATVNWESAAIGRFPYTCVQPPGPENALGLVKFILPNDYSVYLHDTPAKKLFNANQRAFSSGCIRLSNAVALAKLLLRDTPHWQAGDIETVIKEGRTQVVNLTPVPVFIDYMTAWVDRNGKLQFREDLYHRDAAALSSKSIVQH